MYAGMKEEERKQFAICDGITEGSRSAETDRHLVPFQELAHPAAAGIDDISW